VREWIVAGTVCLLLTGCAAEPARETMSGFSGQQQTEAAVSEGQELEPPCGVPVDTGVVSSPEEFRAVLLHHSFSVETVPETAVLVPAAQADAGAEGVFSPILFAPDSYELDSSARRQLTGVASYLLRHGTVRLLIEGHDDDRSEPGNALALSVQRAGRVRLFLILAGIAPGRLTIVGRGATRPADPGQSEDAWQKNRRCEFYFLTQ